MADFVPVLLPSGEQVWVRADEPSRPRDVHLGEAALQAVQAPGFIETVSGVVSSVRMAVDRHRPDTVSVEFGIEINAKTGRVLNVLAEAGGKAHVKVTAMWGRSAPGPGEQQAVGTDPTVGGE